MPLLDEPSRGNLGGIGECEHRATMAFSPFGSLEEISGSPNFAWREGTRLKLSKRLIPHSYHQFIILFVSQLANLQMEPLPWSWQRSARTLRGFNSNPDFEREDDIQFILENHPYPIVF